jgi:hypothetical protein
MKPPQSPDSIGIDQEVPVRFRRFAKLSFFGVAPLLICIAVSPAIFAANATQTLIVEMAGQPPASAGRSIFDTTCLRRTLKGVVSSTMRNRP